MQFLPLKFKVTSIAKLYLIQIFLNCYVGIFHHFIFVNNGLKHLKKTEIQNDMEH